MKSHAGKKEIPTHQTDNSTPAEKSVSKGTQSFADNRPETVAQRRLKKNADESPQVQQLKAYQAMAEKTKHPVQLATTNKKEGPAKAEAAKLTDNKKAPTTVKQELTAAEKKAKRKEAGALCVQYHDAEKAGTGNEGSQDIAVHKKALAKLEEAKRLRMAAYEIYQLLNEADAKHATAIATLNSKISAREKLITKLQPAADAAAAGLNKLKNQNKPSAYVNALKIEVPKQNLQGVKPADPKPEDPKPADPKPPAPKPPAAEDGAT